MAKRKAPIDWFRSTAPYIRAHRGALFVLLIPGEAWKDGALPGLLHDVALLRSLDVRLILVHGSRPQIEERLAEAGIESSIHRGSRVTEARMMPFLTQAVGAQRLQLEALLSMGLPNSPMQGAKLRVGAGNFVLARPLGVIDGVDHHLTGEVRRIDSSGIGALLDSGSVVLLSGIGYSPTGEAFNLRAEDVALSAARALGADKLIILDEAQGVYRRGELLRQCAADEVASLEIDDERQAELLDLAARACRSGVPRCHIVGWSDRDALLTELFSTDGSGTLVARRAFEQSRWATINDVADIIDLLRPLEDSGVLLRRSRELLEAEIGRFRILERDGRVTACAALYPYAEQGSAELACIVTHPDYQGEGRAQLLLGELEAEARAQQLHEVFVLTTQTAHWFIEHGFSEAERSALPPARQALYNLQRNSKVFRKRLTLDT
ncbi:MAG: amino-acid N-acetyltransferase [Halieaceae bacterium]|jgi:amino-acid N-acetyltransferase|nr:amino-acid N-acetyltransferase [Halieaceae bacterium]